MANAKCDVFYCQVGLKLPSLLMVRLLVFVKTRQTQNTHAHTHTHQLSKGHCTEVANDHSVQYIARFT